MARQPARSRSPRSPRSPQSAVPQKQAASTVITGSGQFTGRLLVLLRDDGINEGLAALKSAAGLSDVCRAADFEGSSVDIAQAGKAEVLLLDHLKIAVVTADTRQTGSLMSAMDDGGAIVSVEPERIMYALADGATTGGLQGMPLQYLRGYRDAVNHLYEVLSSGTSQTQYLKGLAAAFADTDRFAWGLQATKVDRSRFKGQDVRVAVLDTGLDLTHPDFAGRSITHASFVTGEDVQDENSPGHGTHCIGTSMGPMLPPGGLRRYGCASSAEIFAGKVLSNAGSGADGGILAGINWAVANQCRIVSMSLGAPVAVGEPFSTIYEVVAQRALKSKPGTLIIAAAGNSSRIGPGQRKDPPNPVGRPANCPSVMAVAAVDSNLGIAPFSDGGINPDGGGVDIAGPGVDVFSSLPLARGGHGNLSGTSMATPHVAGIAALWLEARGPSTTAQELWQILTGNALRLNLPSRDVGAGLVQAPV